MWLYGDTLSFDNGLVNSTAIVQDGGNLHVSSRGTQLLPSDPDVGGRKRTNWVETMDILGKHRIHVTALLMSIGDASVWDFKRWNYKSRTATPRVTAAGDVVFETWTGWTDVADHVGADGKLDLKDWRQSSVRSRSRRTPTLSERCPNACERFACAVDHAC